MVPMARSWKLCIRLVFEPQQSFRDLDIECKGVERHYTRVLAFPRLGLRLTRSSYGVEELAIDAW